MNESYNQFLAKEKELRHLKQMLREHRANNIRTVINHGINLYLLQEKFINLRIQRAEREVRRLSELPEVQKARRDTRYPLIQPVRLLAVGSIDFV